MTRRFSHIKSQCFNLFLAWALVFTSGISQAATYTITDLGANIQPLSISDSGQIVGIDTSASPPRAIYRSGSSWITLNNSGSAASISNSGLVAGHIINTPSDNRAQLWRDGQPINELDAFSGMLEARGINSLDEVVGVRKLDTGVRRPFIFDYITGSLKTLTTLGGAEGWANATNLRGQVTGSAQDDNAKLTAFIHSSDGKISNLHTLDGFTGSEGLAINDDGTVAGIAFSGSADNAGKRALLASNDKGVINLGTLNADVSSVARDVSNDETVVGQSIGSDGSEHAFLYKFASTELSTVAADPFNANRVLIGDSNGAGIFQSSNKGLVWDESNIGLNNKHVSCIEFDKVNPGIIYTCTAEGLYKSVDNGASWRFSSVGIDKTVTTGNTKTPAHIYTVLIDSRNSSGNHLFTGSEAGLFESNDAGTSWTQIKEVAAAVYDLIEQPNTGQFFAGTSRGVYRFRSDLGGSSWQAQNGDATATPPTGLNPLSVGALAIDPNETGTLYAGTLGGSVYSASINDQQPLTWSKRSSGMGATEQVYALKFNKSDFTQVGSAKISKLFAGSPRGLFVSSDQGLTWTRSSNFQTGGVYALSFSFSTTTTLYLTSHDGNVWRSDDNGVTWTNITRGSVTGNVYQIAQVATIPASILAGSSKGVFKLSGTTSWQALFSAAAGTKVVAITANAAVSPASYWVATTDKGIYRSSDDGVSWNSANSGLGNWNVHALLADTSVSPVRLYAGTMGGVYRSENNGDSWTLANAGLNNGNIYSLLLDKTSVPNRLYAGTANGVYRSTDNGNNWVPLNAGLQTTPISGLLLDSTGDIYASSTKYGVFKSADHGVTWTNITGTLPTTTAYAIKGDSATAIYVATAKGVYQTLNGGTTWNDVNLGANGTQLKQTEVFGLEVINANTVYAGTKGKGVYFTTDSGSNWSVISDGLTETAISMQDLTTVVNDANWVLQNATAISNNGQIIGYGLYQGQPHGFLLTPAIGALTANLSIKQSVYPNTIKKGIPLTFQVTVTNTGPAAATHVRLNDWLPPNTVYHNASTNRGGCTKDPSDPLVRCALSDLQPGETATINISLQPIDEGQKLRNIARVAADQIDTDFSDNTTGETDYVQVDRCFIATAAYGSFLDPHVATLRAFRDDVMLKFELGRSLVKKYYQYSPQLAHLISQHESLKLLTRLMLTPVVFAVAYPITAVIIIIAIGAWLIRRQLRNRVPTPVAI